jgi:hypothetical protein
MPRADGGLNARDGLVSVIYITVLTPVAMNICPIGAIPLDEQIR